MDDPKVIAAEILTSLSMAWNAVNLYDHEPAEQPAFQKSLARLQEHATHAIAIKVGIDGFSVDTEDVNVSHAASRKLAERLFLFNVDSFALVRPPEATELLEFLAEIARDDEEAAVELRTRLEAAGVTAFRVKSRSKLVDRGRGTIEDGDDEGLERAPEIKAILELGDRPKLMAKELVAMGDPVAASVEFIERYERLFHKVADDDWVARDRIVQTFVESFFFLPEGFQVAIIESMLDLRSQVHFAMFLDQFATYELAGLSQHLKEGSLALLLDYARVVAEEENSTTELLDLMRSDPELEDARGAIGKRVAQRLKEVQAGQEELPPLDALKREVAGLGDGAADGVEVIRGLFQIETRQFRVRRLVRIWSGRVAEAIENDEYLTALRWVEQAAADLDSMNDNGPIVEEAIRSIATPELIEKLKNQIFGTHRPEAQVRLLELFGSGAGESLIEELAIEEDAGRRRALIDTLTELTRNNHRAVTESLDDPRWFVVRNLAIILAKSANRDAAPAMVSLLSHDDDRVRVEAVRGMVPLIGYEGAATYLESSLFDRSERVRTMAATLLMVARSSSTPAAVLKAIETGPGHSDEKIRLIEVLAKDPSDAATQALASLASKKLAFIGGAKASRVAARTALNRRKRLA